MKQLILIGGGGHCHSCIDVIELSNTYKIKGIIESNKSQKRKVMGYPVLGCDKDLQYIIKNNKNIFITLGQIKKPEIRIKLFNLLKKNKINIPIIISPKAYVSKHSLIEDGTIIMHFACINANVKIGQNCIINSKALIEHDSQIGNNCHISTGARINGSVIIGNNVFIGSGAIIHQGVSIKSKSIIGAGKIIKKNII